MSDIDPPHDHDQTQDHDREDEPVARRPSEREGGGDLIVVGVGASAGGLESLEEFFASLPAEPGMAFVVVQHLSPDFRSMMSQLLSRHSHMPVAVAEDGMVVRRDHVYLLPPRKEIFLTEGKLRLEDKDPTRTLTLPIDLFFRSLAADAGANAVAVVMSGSGSDGSRGIPVVKRAGGRVLVESPETAKFDGMPLSAIATKLVDHVGPARELAAVLMGHYDPETGRTEGDEDEDDLPPMEAVVRLLRNQFGLDFSLYKRSTVDRRIHRRIKIRESEDAEDYLQTLRTDPDELGALYHDLLIGVTRFFRDPGAYQVLEDAVIPDIVERVPPSDEIRVWVAGCATGEEAYSIAILLHEQLTAKQRPLNFKILATDVHRASLGRGSRGIYDVEQLEHVNAARRHRYFTDAEGGVQISPELRKRIVFAPHDVTHNAPFTKMHLITCRNLLIYLRPDAQKTVLSLLHFGLVKDGFLLLGASETVGTFADEFDAVDEQWRVFRKRRDVRLLKALRLPVAHTTLTGPKQRQPVGFAGDAKLLSIYDQLLDRYMPTGFLVDEERQLVDSFNGGERYLRMGRRRPSTHILELLEGDLRTVVGGAIQRVLGAESAVRYSGVPVQDEDGIRRVTLHAEAFRNPRTGGTHALITLTEETPPARAGAADGEPEAVEGRPDDGDEASQDRMNMLESELAFTRETLQAAIEEQQTSNEELQATNEELIASNEELQSTNEELHSVNEELYTVNDEYQKKILELRELNNDIQHLLEGTDIGTLFLDGEMQIRKFTPRLASVFHLRPDDVGRSLRDFSHDLERPELYDEVQRTLETGVVIEDEVQDCHGTTYFLRILPYRAADPEPTARSAQGAEPPASEGIEGVVMSLTDISALDHARSRIHQLSAIVESTEDAIIGKDLDGTITSWNGGAERLYGYTAEEAVGRSIHMLAPAGYHDEIDAFLEQLAQGQSVEHVETVRARKDGELLDVSVTVSPIFGRGGVVTGASAIARDITELKAAQRESEEREERVRLLLDSTAESIFGLDIDGMWTFCNPSCVKMLGYDSVDELTGRHVHELFHPVRADGQPCDEQTCPIYSVLLDGRGNHSAEEVFRRKDGTTFQAEFWSTPIRRGDRVTGAVVTFLDITDRKRAVAELELAAMRREQFLAMLSHELRNPLAAVLNATKVLQSYAHDASAREKAREVIERQSQHMARLLDDLLDVSRITRGGIELRKQDLDFRDAIRAALEAVQPKLEERGLELNVHLDDDPLPVRGDKARLQQIVVNLLSNAARYSPEGSRCELSATSEEGRVVLVVEDHGFGIEQELLPEIFELFVQTEQGLDRSDGGLGVGLALVKQLAELHGGTVEAHSDGPGRGSEFVVSLPLLGHAVLAKEPAAERSEPASRRIVLVEDHDDSREMLRELLESNGHVVFEASNGEEGLETIARVHPDVALVDIGLPVLDGYEVARELRKNAVLDDVVLVALTGYGTDDAVAAAREAGFTEHLTKPADPKEIDRIITRRRT